MLYCDGVEPAYQQTAKECATQYGEEIAHVQRHDSQHATQGGLATGIPVLRGRDAADNG